MHQALVTGAAGFIGTELLNQLSAKRVRIRALVHSRPLDCAPSSSIEVVHSDIEDAEALQAAVQGVDTVFHLAARAHLFGQRPRRRNEYDAINADGTRKLLQAATRAGVRRFIFFSSVKAFGEGSPADRPLDEDSLARPTSPYGRSKLTAEEIVRDSDQEEGIRCTCLRLPMVYGPHRDGNLFRMIQTIERGIFPPLPETGNRRSQVHVRDVVQAALLAASSDVALGQTYIVTDQCEYSTRQIYEMVCESLGGQVPRWSCPAALLRVAGHVGDIIGTIRRRPFVLNSQVVGKLLGSAWYDSSKISRELDYRPTTTLQASLPALITWYREVSR
jgi:UDP-glucose 4-epimerase